MAWNSTVTCSWCYNTGHNRRGCPTLKEYIKDNPESYQAQRAAEVKRRNKSRACSYCLETGHNRRTCEVITKDHELLEGKLHRQRKEMLDRMLNAGLGIGALVKRSNEEFYGKQVPFVVTKIKWKDTEGGGAALPLKATVLSVKDNRMLHRDLYFGQSVDSWHAYEVLSPVSKESIEASVPSEWLNGSLYDSEYWFPKSSRRSYWAIAEEEFLNPLTVKKT